jgi:hypothetical protein
MNRSTDARDEAIRSELVSLPLELGRGRRGVRGLTIAVVLGMVLAGGAVAANATRSMWLPGDEITFNDMAESVDSLGAKPLGEPFTASGSGPTHIDLGRAPSAVSVVLVSIHCLDAGTFKVSVDGAPMGAQSCNASDTAFVNGGGTYGTVGTGNHGLTVTSSGARFMLWASWAVPRVHPELSADQQAALADGEVTRDEYRAGFERYRTCLEGEGYSLVGVDTSNTIFNFGVPGPAVDSGVDAQCYEAEFRELDMAWQISNE